MDLDPLLAMASNIHYQDNDQIEHKIKYQGYVYQKSALQFFSDFIVTKFSEQVF